MVFKTVPFLLFAQILRWGYCVLMSISFYDLNNSEALSRLNIVIRHPNALQPENVMAYDNAVSALGKICQFHRDSIDSAQVYSSGPSFIFVRFACRFITMICLRWSKLSVLASNHKEHNHCFCDFLKCL